MRTTSTGIGGKLRVKPMLTAGANLMRSYRGLVRRREAPECAADTAFRIFTDTLFDKMYYLRMNPDVAEAGVEPARHWLEHGIYEGRLPTEDAMVLRGDAARQVRGPAWRSHVWRGEPIAIRMKVPLPPQLLRQIMDQARHDPAILAPGARAIPNLRNFSGNGLLERDGIDFPALFAAIETQPSTVLVIPMLGVGGAEKYSANLLAALRAAGGGTALIVVTDQTSEDVPGWDRLAILSGFRGIPVLFWRDFCAYDGHRNVALFAQFLNALRPKRLVVINARIGYEAVLRFGRGLSQVSQIACAYFSMGVEGLGVPYGTRYPGHTWPFAIMLTDNMPMAEHMQTLYGNLPGPGVAVLPASITPANEPMFAARLESRRHRAGTRQGNCRWLWVSRVERFKGTALLAELARLRPDDQFDVFGPLQNSPQELGLILPNIAFMGVLSDIDAAQFGHYDGFLFTSLFEGMPNVVLEMSQHAIPLVLADVGGLRDTLDDAGAVFVAHRPELADTALSFGRALDRIADLDPEQTVAMVTASRRQVIARHAPIIHDSNVAKLFGLA